MSQAIIVDNNASLSPPGGSGKERWTAIGDPMEAALIVLANKAGADDQKILAGLERVGQISFDPVRKMMTTLAKDAKGNITAFVKGAGAEVMEGCVSIQWGDVVRPFSGEDRAVAVQSINA